MIELSDRRFGPAATDRLADVRDPGESGAWAALETFYYALNHADLDVLGRVWTAHPLAQLNNPVGGVVRGGAAVVELYGRIFAGSLDLQIEFGDIVAYLGEDHAVFAGRESGVYGPVGTPLAIRTSRYFRYVDGNWAQFHHHGSIDDPQALHAYQRAVAGG